MTKLGKKQFLALAIFGVVAVGLSRCGVPFCVMGASVNGSGACPDPNAPYTANSSSLTLNFVPDTVSSSAGNTSTITVSGSFNSPYNFSIDPSSNPGPGTTLAGTISGSGTNQGTYTPAPAGSGISNSITVLIRVTDSAGKIGTRQMTVTP